MKRIVTFADAEPVLPRFLNGHRGQPRTRCRLYASAGIKLGVFRGKVVAPIMGWYVQGVYCPFDT